MASSGISRFSLYVIEEPGKIISSFGVDKSYSWIPSHHIVHLVDEVRIPCDCIQPFQLRSNDGLFSVPGPADAQKVSTASRPYQERRVFPVLYRPKRESPQIVRLKRIEREVSKAA